MEWRVTVGSGESSSEREREGGKGDARDFLGLVIFWSPVCATAGGTAQCSRPHSRSRLFG